MHTQPVKPQAAVGQHPWWVLALCLLPIAAVAAIALFDVPASTVFLVGVALLCPLLHVFMMRGHNHGSVAHFTHHQHDAQDQPTRQEAKP